MVYNPRERLKYLITAIQIQTVLLIYAQMAICPNRDIITLPSDYLWLIL